MEAARLAMSVSLGPRGESLARYIDFQRTARRERRTALLAEEVLSGEATRDHLEERLRSSPDFAELFEEIVEEALVTRYDTKIRFLARALRHALLTADDAAIDLSRARLRAVADLDSAHVRLMECIATQRSHGPKVTASFLRSVANNRRVPVIRDWDLYRYGPFDYSELRVLLPVLYRNALADERSRLEPNWQMLIQERQLRRAIRVAQLISLTPLGFDILIELMEITGGATPPSTVESSQG